MFDHLAEGRWWDVGLQLVEGCTKVSPGCDNCWSLTAANMRRFNPNPKMAARYEGTVSKWKHPGGERITWTGQVNPQWQDLDKIGRSRTPKVYTFWNDLFHPGIEEEFITSVMLRILTRPQHFYVVCSKRPKRALEYFNLCYPDYVRHHGPDPFQRRLMIMTTAENQEMADLRIPVLMQIPGVLHGVSVEPMLSRVDLWQYLGGNCNPIGPAYGGKGLDWIVCGGETGPHARPMHPDWVRKLRDQAVAAPVPFFLKAWGEWAHESQGYFPKGEINNGPGSRQGYLWPDDTWSIRVGKKDVGRALDEGYWDEVPDVKL